MPANSALAVIIVKEGQRLARCVPRATIVQPEPPDKSSVQVIIGQTLVLKLVVELKSVSIMVLKVVLMEEIGLMLEQQLNVGTKTMVEVSLIMFQVSKKYVVHQIYIIIVWDGKIQNMKFFWIAKVFHVHSVQVVGMITRDVLNMTRIKKYTFQLMEVALGINKAQLVTFHTDVVLEVIIVDKVVNPSHTVLNGSNHPLGCYLDIIIHLSRPHHFPGRDFFISHIIIKLWDRGRVKT